MTIHGNIMGRLLNAVYEALKGAVKGITAVYAPLVYIVWHGGMGVYDLYKGRDSQGVYNLVKGGLDLIGVRTLLGLYEGFGAGVYRSYKALKGEDMMYHGIKP